MLWPTNRIGYLGYFGSIAGHPTFNCIALCVQALPVAALGCTSLRQLLSEAAAVPEGSGTLLHAAVRSECLSMVSVLLDLGSFG